MSINLLIIEVTEAHHSEISSLYYVVGIHDSLMHSQVIFTSQCQLNMNELVKRVVNMQFHSFTVTHKR